MCGGMMRYIKDAVKRKEVLRARDGDVEERCVEAYREERRKVKRCIYQDKRELNEQFGRKMIKMEIGNSLGRG